MEAHLSNRRRPLERQHEKDVAYIIVLVIFQYLETIMFQVYIHPRMNYPIMSNTTGNYV